MQALLIHRILFRFYCITVIGQINISSYNKIVKSILRCHKCFSPEKKRQHYISNKRVGKQRSLILVTKSQLFIILYPVKISKKDIIDLLC